MILGGHEFEYDDSTHTYKVDGEIVQSVTQLLNRKFGHKYDDIPKDVLKKAQEKGTKVHLAVECYCKGFDDGSKEVRNFKFLKKYFKFDVKENELPIVLNLGGKTYAGSRFLSDQIKSHGFRKIYRAVVEGKLTGEERLRGYWAKDEKNNLVRITKEQKNAKDPLVETVYKALAYDAEVNVTLAEVELITGKSHQIRAHLASIGHPLAGDQKYGGHVRKGQRTQMLHAYAVRFPKLEGAFERLSEKEFCCFVGWLKEWG